MQKKAKIALSKREQNQAIVHDFMREHGVEEVDPDQLTAWAINTGRMEPEPTDFFRQSKRELIKAMRGERIVDEQGREIGKMIAIRYKEDKQQKSIWFELLEAKPKRAHVALSQQRRSISAYVRKHKEKTDSYNDNNKYGAELPLFDYNFNKDLKEAQQPTVYPDDKPDGDD